jgi:membrane protein
VRYWHPGSPGLHRTSSPSGERPKEEPALRYIRELLTIFRLIGTNAERKHLPLAAAGLAYNFLLSLIPLLIVLTAVIAYLPLKQGMQDVNSFLVNVVPRQALPVIEDLLTKISPHRTGLLSFGLITAVWLASKALNGIIMGLDLAYDVRAPRRIWATRILAFVLTFIVGLLLVLGVVLMLAGPFVGTLLSKVAPVHSLWLRLWPFIRWSLSVVVVFSAIELLYVLAPNIPYRQRLTIPGAVFASAAWIALAWGFGLYLHYSGAKLDRFYGVLATPIAFMIWLNWSASAILLGAEINASLMSYKRGRLPGPQALIDEGKDAKPTRIPA